MTNDKREALIERIKAVRDDGYLAATYLGEEHVGDLLGDIMAVFEQAHTPTDDEPDALCGDWPAPCNCDDPDTHDGSVPRWLVESERVTPPGDEREALAALIDPDTSRAGWNANAHDVRDQINGLHIKRGVYRIVDRILAAGFRRPVQGEPTDAQVQRALNAYYSANGAWVSEKDAWVNQFAPNMRSALRAAFQTGENRDGRVH